MKVRPISLALQGGGSHGAFTWGVLDQILQDNTLDVKAITATSAGAMNAVAFSAGYHENGREGARAKLEAFWKDVSERGALRSAASAVSPSFGPFTPFAMFQALSQVASPYDLNPFDYNPLQQTLRKLIDFEALRRADGPELFVSATNVHTGRVRVFRNHEISEDSVLASACLPQVFKAVEIEDKAFWDGGYVGNPSLYPLYYSDVPRDMLIIHINPMVRNETPKTAAAILDRLNEITFNASLIAELRSIAFVQKLLDENWLADRIKSKYRRMFVHSIRADEQLCRLSVETKFDTSWRFLIELRNRGREAAKQWLTDCGDSVGKQSTVDIRKEYLEGVD